MELRWLTTTILLLAIGVILRMISPNFGAISLNWNIVMYCTAIMLCRPKLSQAFGIGLVSGIIAMMTSKAALPYANLVSDPIAAMLCAVLLRYKLFDLRWRNFNFTPFVLVFITTCISGGIFVTVSKILLNLPVSLYLYVMLPAVLLVGLLGAIAGQLLYAPAAKIFNVVPADDNSRVSFQLYNINWEVPANSFTVLTGVNGSGKTSLLLTLAGAQPKYLEPVQDSVITVGGIDIINTPTEELNQSIGLVMADYNAQLVTETVADELAFSLETSGLTPEQIRQRQSELLSQVGLADKAKATVASLSGGQKQRLAIACVLAMNTPVIILDEPVAAIDPEGAADIYRLLQSLQQDYHKTIIVTEHDLKYVLDFATQLAVIDEGRIHYSGSVNDCLNYMYEHKVYNEVIPLRWKIRREMGLQHA